MIDGHADDDEEQDGPAAGVVVNIQRFAMLGVEIQRVGAHGEVLGGGLGPVVVREIGNNGIFDLLDAVIGKGCHAAAVGDGDILAGADCQQEKDAALFRAAAQTVGEVVVFCILALVGIADAVHHQKIYVAVVAVAGGFGRSFQLAVSIRIEQAHLVPHQRRGGKGGNAQAERQHQSGQQGRQSVLQCVSFCHPLITTAGTPALPSGAG